MSQELDARLSTTGTRFLIFPQPRHVRGFERPEVVYLNAVPGSIAAGPTNHKMYVVDAPNKVPYGGVRGQLNGTPLMPVSPSPDGHFNHISPDHDSFAAATLFATVHRVLDIWEDYFGGHIPWAFRADFDKLELVPRVEAVQRNAYAGWGYLEFGWVPSPFAPNGKHFFSENFDVVAHEIGHQIKNAIIGPMYRTDVGTEYAAHHESFGDIVAIVASLHFDSFVDYLLETTRGNLFSVNELSRLAELSNSEQIRIVFTYMKFSEITNREEHLMSLPFTGGAFDTLVEIFQKLLIERGIISQELGDLSFNAPEAWVRDVQVEFDRLYRAQAPAFKQALLDARDIFGRLMAQAWLQTHKEGFSFWQVVNNMIDADMELYNGRFTQTIRNCFEWRDLRVAVPVELTQPRALVHGLRQQEQVLVHI